MYETETIEAGESKTYKVVMYWNKGSSNFGLMTNTVSLESTSNEFEYEESDLSNNEDTAQVLVSVSTGVAKVTLIMGIAIIWIVVVICTNARLTLKTAEITEDKNTKK